jgi:hypothetical protein
MPLNHTPYSDLTQEQAALIGRIGIEWSNVEFLLGQLLSRLLMTLISWAVCTPIR